MFETMLAAALQPVYDRLTELEEANERGGRRTRQAIQLGVVKKLVGTRVVIQIGKAHTPPIKWFSLWAGEAMTWRAPSAGEMALVLNYGSGDRNTSSIALVGVDSERYPFPVDDPNLVHQKLGDTGALLEWKLDEGALRIVAPGGTLLDTPLLDCTGEVKDAVRTMSADRGIYNGHRHPLNSPNVDPTEQKQ